MGRHVSIGILLVVVTLAVYGQVARFEFINFDDTFHVTENERVQEGLTWENVGWVFSAGPAPGWYPLAWLAHMADCELFGLHPGGHHVMSLVLHVLNALLLYWVLFRMTGAHAKSCFVAMVFAIHPLHVESVAWVSSRKDVLSAFFCMLTVLAYIRYVERPARLRYALVFVLFALGLLAKPMLVTLPLVLLLLDYWPLERAKSGRIFDRDNVGLLLEKVPLLCLSAVACVCTVVLQGMGGAIQRLDIIPLWVRFGNASLAYLAYMRKAVLPYDLAMFYPHARSDLDIVAALGAAALIAVLSLAALIAIRRRPYATVGWFWYLGMLFPVIGVVQIGSHAMADRFTYLPLIGLLIAVAWGLPEMLHKWRFRRSGLTLASVTTVVALAAACFVQVGYWRTSETLFLHAIEVTENNDLAHNNLGTVYHLEQRYEEAAEHFLLAMEASPNDVKAYHNLGLTRMEQGRAEEAEGLFRHALLLQPCDADVHVNLAKVLLDSGDVTGAEEHCRAALECDAGNIEALVNLGAVLARQGNATEAAGAYVEALALDPDNASAHMNLANLLARAGRPEEAMVQYVEALRLAPDAPLTHYNAATFFDGRGEVEQARMHYGEALRLDPNLASAQKALDKLPDPK